jgi:hypothetical protein
MLPTHGECGQALTNLEEEALLRACLSSRSRSLYTAVTIALTTAMRYCEIRLLTWKQIDLVGATATVGRSKTPAATGRIIPLNSRILTVLRQWASLFPSRQPEHFVFPTSGMGLRGMPSLHAPTIRILRDPSLPGKQHGGRRNGGRVSKDPRLSNHYGFAFTISGTQPAPGCWRGSELPCCRLDHGLERHEHDTNEQTIRSHWTGRTKASRRAAWRESDPG